MHTVYGCRNAQRQLRPVLFRGGCQTRSTEVVVVVVDRAADQKWWSNDGDAAAKCDRDGAWMVSIDVQICI